MNRTEEKVLRKRIRKKRIRDMLILFVCFIFFMTMIYVTDMKTTEMMTKKDDRHAVFVDIEDKTDLRVDIVGETYKFNIEYLVNTATEVINWSKSTVNRIMDKLGS